ncbi:MAG: hypothetical protein H6621_07370 [Halobacteriovoraceae bacterium]|nr:hypothetical protein [Halobacteriovoraceae bacterium]
MKKNNFKNLWLVPLVCLSLYSCKSDEKSNESFSNSKESLNYTNYIPDKCKEAAKSISGYKPILCRVGKGNPYLFGKFEVDAKHILRVQSPYSENRIVESAKTETVKYTRTREYSDWYSGKVNTVTEYAWSKSFELNDDTAFEAVRQDSVDIYLADTFSMNSRWSTVENSAAELRAKEWIKQDCDPTVQTSYGPVNCSFLSTWGLKIDPSKDSIKSDDYKNYDFSWLTDEFVVVVFQEKGIDSTPTPTQPVDCRKETDSEMLQKIYTVVNELEYAKQYSNGIQTNEIMELEKKLEELEKEYDKPQCQTGFET